MKESGLPLVRSRLLSQFPNIICGMSTRQGDAPDSLFAFNLSYSVGDDALRVSEHRRRFFHRLGIPEEHIAFQQQEHGATITIVDSSGLYAPSDALITRTPSIGLSITTADCVPVLVYAPGEKTIAAIHAGWRGSAEHIAMKTLARMKEEFQIDLKNTYAYIGPSAGVCCYEVSWDTADHFPRECVTISEKKSAFLDLKAVNRMELLSAGLPSENIEVNRQCTICKPSIFHSHRRDGKSTGRMLAVIAMKEAV